jgi:hypothetical protein
MNRIKMTIYPKDSNSAKIKLIVETGSILEARQLAEQLSKLIKDHCIVWTTAPNQGE